MLQNSLDGFAQHKTDKKSGVFSNGQNKTPQEQAETEDRQSLAEQNEEKNIIWQVTDLRY